MRYFFVANFIKSGISDYLNLMKFCAEPKNFSLAHLTLKGPFITQQKAQFNLMKEKVEDIQVKLIMAQNFFEYNQNTVFFECEKNEILYNIWKSKTDRTFKTYNPHITIYDGNDKEFSRSLYNIIKGYELNVKLKIDDIDLYNKDRKTEIFKFNHLNFSILKDKSLNKLNKDDLINLFQTLDKDKRLEYIDLIFSELKIKLK